MANYCMAKFTPKDKDAVEKSDVRPAIQYQRETWWSQKKMAIPWNEKSMIREASRARQTDRKMFKDLMLYST